MARILLIDDDADLTDFLREALQEHGHEVKCLERAECGPEVLTGADFDLVLLDNKMPGMSGIEFLAALQQRGLRVPVILMTGHATTDTAIKAMNLGAFDYVIKPLDPGELCDQLGLLIDKALEIACPRKEPVRLPGDAAPDHGDGPQLLGNSKPMQEVYKLIGKVARSDAPVLIHGETGTGKELVARAIHTHSPRQGKPFVAMNCTALNENLLDDELFGHEAHSFTGADKLHKGRFEYANDGTLFLDEVGDMPVSLQAKLLRVLENQEVFRIGSNEPIKVNVRVVSATHRDLAALVAEGQFRADLFYRLNGVTIHLPPLRQRGSDLEFLAEHFLAQAAKEAGRPVPALHPQTLERLRTYPWPGNVRQLQHVLRRAFLVCRGAQILAADLELADRASGSAVSERPDVAEQEAITGLCQAIRWAWGTQRMSLWPLLRDMLERELLKFALAELGGNQTQVADRLNMARGTVIARMQKYGLK